MKITRILSVFMIALLLLLCIPMKTQAATYYTVTFYTNASMTIVHEVQQVERKGHPTQPSTNPATYQVGGYRYEFGAWYWKVEDYAVEFSFTDDNCKIWGDTDIFAGYIQFLAVGYEMIVVYSGGTDFVTDTNTPVTEILKRYPGIIQVYTQVIQDYETGTGSDKPVTAIVNGTETPFGNLADAVAAADANSTVNVLADISVDSALTISKALTIEIGGHKVTGSAITNTAAVTINGSVAGSRLSNALVAKSTLRLNGGDYTGMKLTVQGGTVVITGGTFSFDPSAYVDRKQYDVKLSNGVYTVTPHVHNYDTAHPTWEWIVQNGKTVAQATYPCSCGASTSQTVKPSYRDNRGERTYTATDSYGNSVSMTKTLTYTVTFDGTPQGIAYSWGDICTLTANGYRAWYVGSATSTNKVADGTKTYTFAVTGNTSIVTGSTSYSQPQAAVRATIKSTENATATFNAKWSLPVGASIKSVKVYRGYTTDNKTVDAETLISKGTVFNVDLLVTNGDYTLNIYGLTPTYYQHVVIVITYTYGGTTKTLTSAVQRILPNGQDS